MNNVHRNRVKCQKVICLQCRIMTRAYVKPLWEMPLVLYYVLYSLPSTVQCRSRRAIESVIFALPVQFSSVQLYEMLSRSWVTCRILSLEFKISYSICLIPMQIPSVAVLQRICNYCSLRFLLTCTYIVAAAITFEARIYNCLSFIKLIAYNSATHVACRFEIADIGHFLKYK